MDDTELTNDALNFLQTFGGQSEVSDEELDAAFAGMDELSQQQVVDIIDSAEAESTEFGPEPAMDADMGNVPNGVQDLVTHAINQAPVDFQKTFNDLIASRIEDAVAERKLEVAQSLFAVDEPAMDEPQPEAVETGEVVAEPEGGDHDLAPAEVAESHKRDWFAGVKHKPSDQQLAQFAKTLMGKYKKSESNPTVLSPKSGDKAASASTKG